jgi:hypothetical protein
MLFNMLLSTLLAFALLQSPSVQQQLGQPSWSNTGMLNSGMIVFIDTGSCPTGWTEVSSTGNYILFTSSAAGNAGTTGGSNSYTPAGTNATVSFMPAGTNSTSTVTPLGTNNAPAISWPAGVPTFTGSSGTVPAETFTGSSATTSAVSAGTPAGTISALTTGADSSTTGGVAKAIAQTPTFTGSALSTHTHTLTATGTNGTVSFTPAGTVAWPAGVPTHAAATFTGSSSTVAAQTFTGSSGTVPAETWTGTAATIQPTFIKLIGCKKS